MTKLAVRSGHLGDLFGHFGAMMGGPKGDGWGMYHPRGGRGWPSHEDFTGNRFQVTISCFSYIKAG